MSNSYTLVNPFIHGDFKSTIKSKNSVNAAKSFYKNLSEHFNNNIPKFYFTIQKGGSGTGKYYHFLVKEVKKDDEVKFNIEAIIPVVQNFLLKDLKQILKNLKINSNKLEVKLRKLKAKAKAKVRNL